MRRSNPSPKRRAPHRSDGESKQPVVKLPPEEPAARDEGPRLIPFPADMRTSMEPPRVKHYLELAEKALEQNHKKTE